MTDAAQLAELRLAALLSASLARSRAEREYLVGHFGSYLSLVALAERLEKAVKGGS